MEQFWSTLSKAQGVKQEELEVLGVKDWLDAAYGPRPKVSKEDLLTHLAERSVQVETEVFGNKMAQEWVPVQSGGEQQPDQVLPTELTEPFPPMTIPFQGRYSYEVFQAWEVKDSPAGRWMVVRGRSPRGISVFYVVDPQGHIQGNTLPTLGAAQIEAERRVNPGRQARYDSYIPKLGGTNSREIVLTTPITGLGTDVLSTDHFTNVPNKIGWAQVDDVETVDGKRVLRVRAIQDDTRQKGASEGYRDPKRIAEAKARFEKFDKEYKAKDKVDAEMQPLYDRNNTLYERLNRVSSTDQKDAWNAIYGEIRANTEQLNTLRGLTRQWMEIGNDKTQAQIDIRRAEKGQPDVPFKNQWHEVVVKRLLRLAADEGYDGVAFSPPSQQITEWQAETDPKRAAFTRISTDRRFHRRTGSGGSSSTAGWSSSPSIRSMIRLIILAGTPIRCSRGR